MAIKVEMPKLSDTMDEGVLVSWSAEEGDEVSAGDVIAQVETDKATMDLEVYDDGVLLKKVVEEGASVPLGGLIAVLGEEGEDISELLAQAGDGEAEEESEAAAERTSGDGSEGASKETSEEASEEKEGAEAAAPAARGDGGVQGADGAPAAPGTERTAPQRRETEPPSGNGRLKVSPLARRLAGEHGVDLGQVSGSGPEGRIIKRDIEELVGTTKTGRAAEQGPAADRPPVRPQAPSEPAFQRPAEVYDEADQYESRDISQMRKTIARRLAQSKYSAPHFYLTVDVDMARAAAFRSEVKERAGDTGTRISYNDLITKACAMALRRHPQVNASYLPEESEIRYYKQVHVAVAVAVEEGLVTPVIRHADRKGMSAIAEETREKADRARQKQLDLDEMEGSTFTTSNLGMYGIEEFTAIINPPNACLLAIGAVRDVPVIEEGEVVPGKRMRLTLSCDHRIVDGATGAQFLQTVQDYLEEPLNMLL